MPVFHQVGIVSFFLLLGNHVGLFILTSSAAAHYFFSLLILLFLSFIKVELDLTVADHAFVNYCGYYTEGYVEPTEFELL